MDGDGGGSSGDVSLMATHHEVRQPSVWPPMGPTENDVAFFRRFLTGMLRLRAALGVPNTPWRSSANAATLPETRDDDGDGGDDGDPRHADADAGADDDDAYGGFGFGFGAVVPASGVAIACLPETTVGVGDGEGEGEEATAERGQRCAVCLEDYDAGDALRTMPCAHGFHECCIFRWLRVSRVCPLCRFALPPEEDMDVEATDDDDAGMGVGRDDRRGEADDDDGGDGAVDTFEHLRAI